MCIKIQGFRKICCFSKPEVSSRNTRHARAQQIMTFCLACVPDKSGCHSHDLSRPCGIAPSKKRWRIFIMPVPSKKVFTHGNNRDMDFASQQGFRDVGTDIIKFQ